MKLRLPLLPLLTAVLFACGGQNRAPVPTPEEEPLTEEAPPFIFSLSGTASVHPAAAAWLEAQGQTVPSLEGLSFIVSEPVRLALGEEALLAEQVLDGTGTYQIPELSTAHLVQEIAGEIRDPSPDGSPLFVRSATTLYDYWLEGGQPRENVVHTRTYALPTAFEAGLSALLTPERIASLQAPNPEAPEEAPARTLQASGFVLGRITDASGAPLAGASVQLDPATDPNRIFYPSADYSTVGTDATSANGLFVYVHSGTAEPRTLKFTVEGDAYEERSAVTLKGVATLVDVYPGRTRPR